MAGPSRRSVLAGLAAAPLLRPGPARADGGFGRGVNIPDWLDEGLAPARGTLAALAGLGFDHVRLPIASEGLTADATTRRDRLSRVSAALSELEAHGLVATIDLHPSGHLLTRFEADARGAASEVVAAWSALAPAIADLPDSTAAELLNEPPLWPESWLPLRDRLAEIVRRAAPRHPIVWGAGRYQTIGETLGMAPLVDDNAVVAVHFYWPMSFTHQGESWGNSVQSRFHDLPFPLSTDDPALGRLREDLAAANDEEALAVLDEDTADGWQPAMIDAQFLGIADWAQINSTRVVVNEFGALGFSADRQSRTNWLRAARRAAERHGVGWTVWELDHGFGIMGDRLDAASVDPGLVDALVGAL